MLSPVLILGLFAVAACGAVAYPFVQLNEDSLPRPVRAFRKYAPLPLLGIALAGPLALDYNFPRASLVYHRFAADWIGDHAGTDTAAAILLAGVAWFGMQVILVPAVMRRRRYGC